MEAIEADMQAARLKALEQVYDHTRQAAVLLEMMRGLMNEDDPDMIDELNAILERRSHALAVLEEKLETVSTPWSPQEQQVLADLQQQEATLRKQMSQIHTAYQSQMNQREKGKQVANRYAGTSGAYAKQMDGSYFDQRK